MFCCPGFENHVKSAGNRGIGVLVEKIPEGFMFVLQSRGIAYEDERKIQPVPSDININVSSSVGMKFCPWCGYRLQELVNSSYEELTEIAEQHKKYNTLQL
jgi:hypothetical protein